MSMTVDQAQTAVNISAVVVVGVYAYRKLVEPQKKSSSTAHFVIGFGFVYFALALVAQAAPSLGGGLAVLIAGGDLLTNGIALSNDLTGALKATA